MPFELQPTHILLILAVALIIFGPSKLPELGRGLGKAIVEFRKEAGEMTDGFREEIIQSQSQNPTGTDASTSIVKGSRAVGTGNFCTQCGAPNPAEARFCNQCGTRLPSNP